MPAITFISDSGTTTVVDATSGDSVMQVALNNMIEGIVGECGGCMSCATCHVYVDDAWAGKVGQAGVDEQAMLQLAVKPSENSRLSCQITVGDDLDGLIVRLPESQF